MVSPTFDPSGDFVAVCDGLAAVTLLARGTGAESWIAHALRRSIGTREIAASDGRYIGSDVRFHLPVAEQPSRPNLGDVILDGDGDRYTILEVSRDTLGDRWRCICRNPVIAYGLNDTIEILRAAYTKGEGGAPDDAWTVERTGVRARIQPGTVDIGVQEDARRTVERFAIFVADDVAGSMTIAHDRRLRDQAGKVYRITGMTGAERIGELAVIDAEISPWPFG